MTPESVRRAIVAATSILAGFAGPSLAQHDPPRTTRQVDAAAWREDVAAFAAGLRATHANLEHTLSREAFDDAVRRLDERVPSLKQHEIIVELARIVARIGDGHTRMDMFHAGFHTYPIRFYSFADGLYVVAAPAEHAALVGGRVTRLGRIGVDEALARAGEIIPADRGNPSWKRFVVAAGLTLAEPDQALGITEALDALPITVEKDGREIAVTLRAVGPDPAGFGHGWPPRKSGWVDARDVPGWKPPLWLKAPDDPYWLEYLADTKTLYVQYNAVRDKPEESIAAFFERVAKTGQEREAERLVLDLRLNGGGNNYLNRPIIHALIRSDRFNQPGRLYVIVGRQTFSAAMNCVNEIELNTRAIFVGEPTGAAPNHYGDADEIVLPNSGLTVRASTLWWQDQDPRDRRAFLAPQLAAELTYDDYRRGDDPAMRTILAHKAELPLPQTMRALLENGDARGAIAAYRAFRADPVNRWSTYEREINSLGYRLLELKRAEDAVAILTLNVETVPESWNAHDSLGEAYRAAGNREQAVFHYRRSLELNPRNRGAADALRGLAGS